MKHYSILLITLGVSLLTGCIRELEPPTTGESRNSIRLTAHMEGEVATKTVMSDFVDGFYYPLWEPGDSLAVFADNNTIADPFTLISGEGETTAIFEGTTRLEAGDSFVAFFPYSSSVKRNGDELSFTLPAIQKYKQSSFPANGYPMIATSRSEELSFKNLCSIVRISLTGSCLVNTITLRAENEFLSGPASVRLDYEEVPTLIMQDGGANEVTLNCLGVPLTKETAKDFYIVVPANVYGSLTIVIDAFTGSITKTVSTEVALNRSRVRPFNPFTIEVPAIDLDNLPNNQIWYKTSTREVYSFRDVSGWKPFNAEIVAHEYVGDYGIIVLDGPVKTINSQAFRPISLTEDTITELHLPDCVEEILAIALPTNLESLRVPASLTLIEGGNIDGSSENSINRLYGPLVAADERSIVRDGVLLGVLDRGMEEYITPPEVKIIPDYGLRVTNIKTLTLSEGFESLGSSAGPVCYSAPNLEIVNLPESIQSIKSTFHMAPKLKGFYGNARCTSPDHLCLIDPGYRSSYGPALKQIVSRPDIEQYTIPEGIGMISTAFSGWTNLRKIVLPESLMHFSHSNIVNLDCSSFEGFVGSGVSADGRCVVLNGLLEQFYGNDIEEYDFPASFYYLPFGKVGSSFRLKKVSFGEGLIDIDFQAFAHQTQLQSVSFPTTIRSIGSGVFDGATNMESVYLPVRVPPTTSGMPSDVTLPKLKVYVPEESIDDYMSSTDWAGWRQYLTPYHFDNIDPPAPYVSTDYSMDGKVTVLQTATEGNGVDLVLMGRGYSDRLIADGTYLSNMEEAAEAFFEPEPFHSFRHLFNVYVVNVVSEREDEFPGVGGNTSRYLQSANHETFLEYAMKAVPDERIDYATISILHYTPYSLDMEEGYTSNIIRSSALAARTDYGTGIGFAVYAYTPHGVKPLTRHEVGGHGFGKLYDEYIHLTDGAYASPIMVEALQQSHMYGENLNVEVTSDPERVLWAHFLSDPRYENEKLGVFEGCNYHGLYRPSENSIMNDCQGGYNAPSREAIYRRIHKIAYGANWEYDYEKFVEYDLGAKNIHPTAAKIAPASRKNYEVRDPLPVTSFNPKEWTVTTME